MINTINIVPRYAETDKMGIVHHSVYAIWYELARTEYFNKIGLRYDEIEESGIITPLVELNCKYKLPAYYNQEVSVETKLIKLTPAKFILQYDVYDKDGKHLNVGTTTLAWLMPELSRFSISSGHIQPYIPNSCSCWKNKNSFLSSGRLHRYLKTFYTDAALQQSESARPINIEDSSSVLALPGRPVFISDRLYHIFDHFRILSSICGLIYKFPHSPCFILPHIVL